MSKSDTEFFESIIGAADVLPMLFSTDVGIAITDKEKYVHTRQPETFKLQVEEGMTVPEKTAVRVAIAKREKQSQRYPKEVFGFPINCFAVPLINPDTDNVVGTIVYAVSLEQENKIYDMVSELQAFSEELSASSEELASSTQELASNNQNVSSLVNETHDSIDSLNSIVSYTKKVADNTNLLGLNAAIEAARAGEYGRGFGVVAEEIRKLSKGSKESTEKINDILTQIKNNINSVLGVLKGFSDIGNTQAAQAEEIASGSQRLSEISDSLLKLTEISGK